MNDSGKVAAVKNSDVWAGGLLIVLSVIGYASTCVGKWSTSAGGGSRLFPRFAFFVILLSGVAVVVRALRKGPEGMKLPELSLPFTVTAFLFLGGYLLVLRYIGLVVGTFITLALVFGILTPERRPFRDAVLPAFCVTLIVWVLFSVFMRIVLPAPLLF